MPLTSDINSSSFHLGMEVLRAQVAATGRGEFTMGGKLSELNIVQQMGAFWPAMALGDYLLNYCF